MHTNLRWIAQKLHDKKQHYLQVTLNYLKSFNIQPSVKKVNKAATCLFNAKLLASLFLKKRYVLVSI